MLTRNALNSLLSKDNTLERVAIAVRFLSSQVAHFLHFPLQIVSFVTRARTILANLRLAFFVKGSGVTIFQPLHST